MAWGKTDEEKAAASAAKQREAYLKTPVGQAEEAKQRGDAFFQFEHDIATLGGAASALGSSSNRVTSRKRPDVLGQIEEIGWHLENVGYVFIETGSTSTNRMLSTGQGTVTRGMVRGIYLFRNTDA